MIRIALFWGYLMENLSFSIKDPPKTPIRDLKMRVFTCQQCEYRSSGSDVLVNAVIIHRYILPRTTAFPQCKLIIDVCIKLVRACLENWQYALTMHTSLQKVWWSLIFENFRVWWMVGYFIKKEGGFMTTQLLFNDRNVKRSGKYA